jgi:hypothetical protein
MVTLGIPVSRDARRIEFHGLRTKLSQLFHCSNRNTWATWWLGMAHGTSGLNKILMPRVNCRPIGRFLEILSAKFPLNLCSRHRFLEAKHTTSMLCICESSHPDINCGSVRGGCTGYYSTTCIKLAMFCYIMTIQNVVHVPCINLYILSKL